VGRGHHRPGRAAGRDQGELTRCCRSAAPAQALLVPLQPPAAPRQGNSCSCTGVGYQPGHWPILPLPLPPLGLPIAPTPAPPPAHHSPANRKHPHPHPHPHPPPHPQATGSYRPTEDLQAQHRGLLQALATAVLAGYRRVQAAAAAGAAAGAASDAATSALALFVVKMLDVEHRWGAVRWRLLHAGGSSGCSTALSILARRP
jgi:hypothetical protein